MANCPKCGKSLNFWNVKAECPYCGINIPNYDWEGRLDSDAKSAEIAWSKFRKFTGNFKSALFGSKLRIIRFFCTFLPIIALVLPLADFGVTLPFINDSPGSISLLSFTLNNFTSINWGSLIHLTSLNILGAPFTMLIVSILLLYLAVVFGVLNFVFVLLLASKLKAGLNIFLCYASTFCFAIAGVLFTVSVSAVSATSSTLLSGSLQYGLFIGILLFSLNIALNTIAGKSFKKERANS